VDELHKGITLALRIRVWSFVEDCCSIARSFRIIRAIFSPRRITTAAEIVEATMAALMWQRQFPHTSVLSTASISVPQSCSSHVGFFLGSPWTSFVRCKRLLHGNRITRKRGVKLERTCVIAFLLPVDPWNPNSDSQGIASSLFASSLLPYLGFLYHITKSKTSPKLTLFGFYFLLAFVGATSNSSRSPSSTIFGSAFS
jgi:hypothetical protein